MNISQQELIGWHYMLYVNAENKTYFDSFGAEHILKEIKKIYRKRN